MTINHNTILSGRVLAVLVLYNCPPEDAGCWPSLVDMLPENGMFSLQHCLIFDNSPEYFLPTEYPTPDGFELRRSPENVGTAGAYAAATTVASARNCDWLLLLDQDTVLPRDYLKCAAENSQSTNFPGDVIVPRVWHGNRLISPSLLSAIGNIRATTDLSRKRGIPTAISSGVLVRTKAIQAILPFPQELWLDYVDHWMFLNFAQQGLSISEMSINLKHDLSIRNPGSLLPERLQNVLCAETFFYHNLGYPARLFLPLRQFLRAVRFMINGHKQLAIVTIKHLLHRRAPR